MHEQMTMKEAAEALGLAESSIRRMVVEGQLSSRQATSEEVGSLFAHKRIAGVPGRGVVRLISRQAVLEAMARPKAGRPKKQSEPGEETTE